MLVGDAQGCCLGSVSRCIGARGHLQGAWSSVFFGPRTPTVVSPRTSRRLGRQKAAQPAACGGPRTHFTSYQATLDVTSLRHDPGSVNLDPSGIL
jgi:hypothetical protein